MPEKYVCLVKDTYEGARTLMLPVTPTLVLTSVRVGLIALGWLDHNAIHLVPKYRQ